MKLVNDAVLRAHKDLFHFILYFCQLLTLHRLSFVLFLCPSLIILQYQTFLHLQRKMDCPFLSFSITVLTHPRTRARAHTQTQCGAYSRLCLNVLHLTVAAVPGSLH